MPAVRPNVGDGHDVDVIRIQRPDEHVAFVARADDADAQPVIELRAVVEVLRAQARRRRRAADDADVLQKLRRVVPTASSKFCLPSLFSSGVKFIACHS